jgi:hypothetical protein
MSELHEITPGTPVVGPPDSGVRGVEGGVRGGPKFPPMPARS